MRTLESIRHAEQNELHRQGRRKHVATGASYSGEFAESDALEREIMADLQEECGASEPRLSVRDLQTDPDWNV